MKDAEGPTYSLVQWFFDVTDACTSGASSDHRKPLHQAVWTGGLYVYSKYPSPRVGQLRKSWGSIKPEPRARVLCRGFFQLINVRARDLLYLWYTPGHMLMSYDILLGCFSSRLCVASICHRGACTGSSCMQSPKWLERSFLSCICQLADGSGRQPSDSWSWDSGPGSIPANAG